MLFANARERSQTTERRVVVAVVFLALLASAGVRAAVLINPLENELG